MNVLLIEDERRLSEALTFLLKKNGYAVDAAFDGEAGSEMLATGIYDLVILDRMLPKKDGLTVLQEMRQQGIDVPVLFLTAKDEAKERVEGLDAGADDYLVKPFSTEELFARLRALGRRAKKPLHDNILVAGGLQLDPLKCEAVRSGEVIQLTVKESLLLEILMRNYGRVVTKEQIFTKVWGYYSEIELANVELYIHYLRKKIPEAAIKTIRGVGYCLEGE